MSSIEIYVLNADNYYDHTSVGSIDSVIESLAGNDYTLTPPPDYERRWKWIDNKWVADNTAS